MKNRVKLPLRKIFGIGIFAWLLCLLAACAPQDGNPHIDQPQVLTPTVGRTMPTEPLRMIRFVDQTHAWALTTDRVLRSLDGGKTWTDVTKRGNGGSMMDGGKNAEAVFQTADLAWVFVVVRKNGDQQAGVTVHVWHTMDGGKNWDTSAFDDNDALGVADRPNFAGPQNGWLLLGTGAATGSYGAHLYNTKDGGVSWQQIAAAPGKLPLSGEKSGPSFTDEKNGWLAQYIGAISDDPLIDHSTDGGVTWSAQKLPLVQGVSQANYRTTPPVIFGQVMIVPVHIIIGTKKELLLYVSDDGGNHWYPQQLTNFDTDTIYVIDPNHTVALDNGAVDESKDRGGHWSKVGTLPATAGAMSFVSVQEGWSLDTQSAVLYHTTDGGVSWQTITYSFVAAS